MATSGTFTGSRGGNSYGPWLELDWSRIQEDIPNNRSLIRLTLKLISDRPIQFSASKTGVLDGTSFTYTGNFSGPATKVIKTKDVWVGHDSDGGRTESFSANLNIAITWGGSHLSSISVSGNASINTIPRASDFTAFTLSNTTLNTSTATTINYTIGRKSTAFTQDLVLKYGSRTIASWNTSGTGALTRTLSASEVNTILNAMTSVTSGNLTLTMQTKSGSSKIGSPKSINEGISLNAAIKPSASSLSVAISGSGRDKTIGQYVQSISKVVASFTRSAGYGASVESSTISVKRSDGKNLQIIESNSGTIENPMSLSGTYNVIGTVEDSRGRTATVSASITVAAYSPPTITNFIPARVTPSTTVTAPINAKWSALGTSNPTTVTIVRKTSAGLSPTTLYTLSASTAGSLVTTRTFTAQSDASSFIYTLKVVDSFGKVATAEVSIGTSFVEFTISKGKGIGVGKVHERGALDVHGDAHFKGFVDIAGVGQGGPTDEGALRITGSGKAAKIQYGSSLGMGDHAYFEWSKNGVREGYVGIPTDENPNFHVANRKNGADGMFALGNQKLFAIDNTATYNGVPVFTSDGGITGGDLLWEGGIYLNSSQTINPTKNIQDCVNGWALCWSEYVSGSPANSGWQYTFIPKRFGTMTTGGMWVALNGNAATPLVKYIYVSTTAISGHSRNSTAPENQVVLRFVYSW